MTMGEANQTLKMLRLKNGLNQEEMARKLGMSRQNYGLIETGKAPGNIRFWAKLQRAFDLSGADMWSVISDKEKYKAAKV